MNTHADQIQENKSQSVANGVSQMKSSDGLFQFEDNRPEAAIQRKMQQIANNSPKAMQLKAFQEMTNPQSKPTAQLEEMEDGDSKTQQAPVEKPKNNTGLPDNLKSGIENLSGYSMDDVKVHRNSAKPAQLQAHAYAQGSEIHLASGQEKHLPHEAWHVVQQKQGRVKPTKQLKGKVNVNDDKGLEQEADVMGGKAMQFNDSHPEIIAQRMLDQKINTNSKAIVQGKYSSPVRFAQTSQQLNTSLVQLEDDESSPDDKMGLDKMINRLEASLIKANSMAHAQKDDEDFSDLAKYINQLRSIAIQSDNASKSILLIELQEELNEVDVQETITHTKPVQRVGILGGLLIGAGIVGLAVAVRKVYTYLRERQEDRSLEDYYATGVVANAGIPAELTSGIAALPTNPLKAARLFQNINNFRFRYTGNFVNPVAAYSARQGDCQTLVGLYQNVAAAQGIPFAVGNLNQRQLVAPRPIHGRNTTSNTEGNTDWYFREHYWAIGAGTAYDVLFMISPPPPSVVSIGSAVHNGVTYYIFADGRSVIEPGQAALGYDIQEEGRVFVNAAAAIAFINAHP